MRLWLRLKWLHARFELANARRFRAGLEETIIRERARAQRGVEDAELMERRAELAFIAARIDEERARA